MEALRRLLRRRLRRCHGFRDDGPDLIEEILVGRREKAIVSDLVKSLGKDMLEVSSDEFFRGEGAGLPGGLLASTLTKADPVMLR